MATDRLKTPLLFPCAARVKMPQLGAEEAEIKNGLKSSRLAPDSVVFQPSSHGKEPVSQQYLKKVSMDLSFDEAVVRERCFFALPYDEKYMYEAFDISDIVTIPIKSKLSTGRHNPRGVDLRHMPCNLTKTDKSNLKPLKRKIIQRAREMHLEALKREEKKQVLALPRPKSTSIDEGTEETESSTEPSVFLTETKLETKPKPPESKAKPSEKAHVKAKGEEPVKIERQVTEVKSEIEEKDETTKEVKVKTKSEVSGTLTEEEVKKEKGNHWDSYLMSLLSQNTANWLVYNRTAAGSMEREKLEALVKQWYGSPEHTDLVFDSMSESEDEEEKKAKKQPKKKWKKKEATLLERVYNLENAPPHALDPYSDDSKAPFYRQPAGLRRAKKHEEKEELGAINKLAADVEVKSYKPPPPPKLRDFMNPEIRERMYDTDNMFQQEQLTGTEQIHEIFGDKNKIVMATHNKYQKELQEEYPQPPRSWYPETEEEKLETSRDHLKRRKQDRGHKRWKKLPQPIDDTAEVLNVLPPGYESNGHKSTDLKTRKTAKANTSLLQIIDEWRSKWHLSGQYADSSPDDLIKDMADIQAHVRLKAIATCAKAADYKPPEDQGIHLDYLEKDHKATGLPERLFVALECLLDDQDDKVRKAAAITLYSLSRPSKKAEGLLYEALESDNAVDRWAAAQCLAHFGVCDSDVIGEILKQVLNTEDTVKHERGITMLGILSISSKLVHSMVAEQLNSSSWRHKVIACKILPTLKGDINRDITNKLSDLMWNDWHAEVRRSAAQCLGKTGHGRDVHDDLRTRILEGTERIKLEAISKVGQLGIMTAKLLPAFLKCFEDEYVSIRSEACITCGNLAIKDEEVIAKLLHLATFDTIWKVKALAFQALGKIGVISEQVVDCLLWAVRYEERPGVRAEACHTLKVLNVKTEEVADVLQDRFLVESSPLVRDEIASALAMFNISATEDMDMVAQIKKEVRKLCTRNIIASQIQINEEDQDRRENLTRMIYESEREMRSSKKQKSRLCKKSEVINFKDIQGKILHHSHLKPSNFNKQRSKKTEFHYDPYTYEFMEKEPEHESVMERLRSRSRAESRRVRRMAGSGASSPEPGREGAFTPTADQELEAILAKEEVRSGATSPSGRGPTPATTPGTTKSEGEGQSEEDEGEESKGTSKKKDVDAEPGESETPGTTELSTQGSQTPGSEGVTRETPGSEGIVIETPGSEGEDTEKTKSESLKLKSSEGQRPTSVVKFASHLEVADIPRRAGSALSSRLSFMEDGTVKQSRMSNITGGTENMVFGREAVIEREKINTEARNTFAVMDARYQDMVNDLIDLDNAFELGLMNGNSREEFEKRIQNVRIIKTPPRRPQDPPQIELTVDEVIPVEKEETIASSKDKSDSGENTEKVPSEDTQGDSEGQLNDKTEAGDSLTKDTEQVKEQKLDDQSEKAI